MSVEIVRNYFKEHNINKEILEFPVSSATVELAAEAVGTEPARIAKNAFLLHKGKGCRHPDRHRRGYED